jgi:iron complex transport system permease protein
VGLTRIGLFVVVTLLAGGATAACGPIVFIGLVVPHVARAICGPDYRWIMVYSLVLSPIVLLSADVLGRIMQFSGEVQVGVVLGLLGAPVFAFLIRRRNLSEL